MVSRGPSSEGLCLLTHKRGLLEMANKDGLEPNKKIDFKTLQDLRRKQQQQVKQEKSKRKPNRRTNRERAEVELDDIVSNVTSKAKKGEADAEE